MIFRRPAPAPSETPAPMTEAAVMLEHANIMQKLAADMASQYLTLMLVGDGSPMNNLVRDTAAPTGGRSRKPPTISSGSPAKAGSGHLA